MAEKKILSIRIPKYQHDWIKARSKKVKEEDGKFHSMNTIIQEAIDEYMEIK